MVNQWTVCMVKQCFSCCHLTCAYLFLLSLDLCIPSLAVT
jgi:hypothetical protein